MNCGICLLWDMEIPAEHHGTWSDGKPLSVCETCYRGGALVRVSQPEETPEFIYGASEKFVNDNWIVKPKRRLVIQFNPETGFRDVIDRLTGKKMGNAQTDRAARIIRRRLESGGYGK